MDVKFLKDIGLTDNEIAVYLELLKSQESTATEISDTTEVNRTLVYQLLGNLIRRGLASYVIKNNVRHFKAAHPSKLLDYLKGKELNIQKMLPELMVLTPREPSKHNVELYEGKEGLKTIMNDIIQSNTKEWLDFTSGLTIDILPDYFMDQWEKKRIKAKIKARFLINDTKQGKKRGKRLSMLQLSQARYLPKGLNSPSHIYIYANKVGIALWEKEFPFGVVIESQEISNRFREFFEWFWKNAIT